MILNFAEIDLIFHRIPITEVKAVGVVSKRYPYKTSKLDPN